MFRSTRWAILDHHRQVFEKKYVEESNETGKLKNDIEEFRNREAQVCEVMIGATRQGVNI